MEPLLRSSVIQDRMSEAGICSQMGACLSELSQALLEHNLFIAPF